jgi:hypothetical protein
MIQHPIKLSRIVFSHAAYTRSYVSLAMGNEEGLRSIGRSCSCDGNASKVIDTLGESLEYMKGSDSKNMNQFACIDHRVSSQLSSTPLEVTRCLIDLYHHVAAQLAASRHFAGS